MKIRILASMLALVCAGTVQAQSLKVATVDMASLLNGYHRTADANQKIQSSQETARQEVERMTGEGQALVREFEELRDRAENPALTDAARTQAENDRRLKEQSIIEKRQELEKFLQDTQRALQQRIVQHRALLIDEIKQAATTVAKARGANLLLDTSSLGGELPSVLFADPSWDITPEVLREINKDAPAGFTPPAPGQPALAPAARP